jgi:flagellar protein FliO/FliZ
LYLGGEKLNRFSVFWAVVLLTAGVFVTIPPPASAQTPDSPGASAGDVPFPAQSDETLLFLEEEAPGAQTGGQSSFWLILRMVFVLALVAGAIYLVVFLLKRVTRPAEQLNPHLKVLAGSHLGSNRYVYVVSVGSKAWLLGASDGGVSLIAEISDPDVVNAMLLDDSRKSAESAGRLLDFSRMLRRLGGGAGPDAHPPSPEDLRKRRERLKGL